MHVRLAGEAQGRELPLDIEAIVAAARGGRRSDPPGLRLLSENEDFAAAQQGWPVFIGPSAGAIAAMGDKAGRQAPHGKAGVPPVPAITEEQDPAPLEREAARIGFPVLIKPSAGGGGKESRVVSGKKEFVPALEASRGRRAPSATTGCSSSAT